MLLSEFIASRRHCDDLRTIPDSPYGVLNSEDGDYPDPIDGFVYADSYAIRQHPQDNGFTCFIQFEESSPDLRSLELDLFYYYGRHVGQEVELTMFDRVEMAALQSDLDRACRYVQDGLGVESGDRAALYFSDLQEGEWDSMSPLERLQRLNRYIAEEIGGEIRFRLSNPDSRSQAQAPESAK